MVAASTAKAGLEDPAGCFQLIAPAVQLLVFRANGMTGVVGSVSECETLVYQVKLMKAQALSEVCAISGGSLIVTTPDGVEHRAIEHVPCFGGAGDHGSQCDPATPFVLSPPVEYQVRLEDVVAGAVTTSVRYEGWAVHSFVGSIEGPPQSAAVPKPIVLCLDANACTSDLCDPTKQGAAACSNPVNPAGCFLCGDGLIDPGEVCDAGALNGRHGSCCSFDCQQVRGAGETCRAARGACDAAETCDGLAGICPADAKVPADTVCRPASGPCDLPETCDGIENDCSAVDVLAAETVCRPATDECDASEQCNGLSPECPPDGKAEAGTSCGEGDSCNGLGTCVDTCGDGVVEGKEECDLPAVPAGAWCTVSCRVTTCGWPSIRDTPPPTADGGVLACSLATALAPGGCDGSTRAVKRADALRAQTLRRLRKLRASGCRKRSATRLVRGVAHQLDRASAALPVDECARDVVGPAFLVWGQLLSDLRSHPERMCEGDVS